MRVRSFEMSGIADGHLRKLHDHLMESGGFEFRAGGSGFFVVVRERFVAATGASFAQMIMAAREDDTINIDALVAGGGEDSGAQLAEMQRETELLRGFAERHGLTIADI
ncbi:MAG: hypothetical protein AAF567_08420 [Actinomycetota bacterium]